MPNGGSTTFRVDAVLADLNLALAEAAGRLVAIGQTCYREAADNGARRTLFEMAATISDVAAELRGRLAAVQTAAPAAHKEGGRP